VSEELERTVSDHSFSCLHTWGCRGLAHLHPGGISVWREVAQLEQHSESTEAKESRIKSFNQVIIDKPSPFLPQLKSAPSRCMPCRHAS